jgi:deoxycytidine triphosphate deaminase
MNGTLQRLSCQCIHPSVVFTMGDMMDEIGFLIDRELERRRGELFENLPEPRGGDWYSAASPIQPAAVDLRVGKIYVPQSLSKDRGGIDDPYRQYRLSPGETVIIVTAEQISLPNDMLGLGFAPTSLAMLGILTPTIGHIDPGWSGPLRIVAINMGQSTVSLQQDTKIATILLFSLRHAAQAGYQTRKGSGKSEVDQTATDALAPDFADFKGRAETAAEKLVNTRLRDIWIPLIITAVAAPTVALLVSIAAQLVMENHSRLSDRVLAIEQLIYKNQPEQLQEGQAGSME